MLETITEGRTALKDGTIIKSYRKVEATGAMLRHM